MKIRLIRKNEERIATSEEKAAALEAKGFKRMKEVSKSDTLEKKEIYDMTVDELKNMAKEKGLTGYSALSKEELLSILKEED